MLSDRKKKNLVVAYNKLRKHLITKRKKEKSHAGKQALDYLIEEIIPSEIEWHQNQIDWSKSDDSSNWN